jgi:choline dehydrogenase-like flavoprotein
MATPPPLAVAAKSGERPDTSSTLGVTDEYDFIVIGGGTAGLSFAARLTENPTVRVIVVEAGADRLDDPKILIPGLAHSMYDDPNYDWCFLTVPQVRSHSCDN